MTVPSSSELNLLKSRPHSSKAWLSIYQPQVALACRVNDATITKGARAITFDGVTTGSYSLVEANFIALIGTALGKEDKGRIRVKSATSSVLTVAENSHIDWQDDDFVTVLRYVEPVPIFTRIIQNPADEEDVIFYKDYDVAYSNQNTVLGAFVSMGSHFAGFLDESSNCQIYYSASGTAHVIDGTALTYEWWFQGAETTGSSSHTPGYINYKNPGHYITRLKVTGANSSLDTSYRFISVYDNPSRGTSVPILDWSTPDISGSRDSAGYKSRIKVRTSVPESIIRDNALVVIFTDDYYGSVKQSLGASKNRSSIRFVGYIVDGTIDYNYKDGYIEFEVESPTGIMQRMESFSVSVESSASPTKWFELLNMNCKRAIYHYLRWHSTILNCNDFEFNGTDYNIQYFDADRTSLYDGIHNFIDGTLWGSVICDRQGKIWAEVDYDAYSDGGDLPVNMTIDSHDIIGTLNVEERQVDELSYLELGGIKYDGPAAGTFQALLCEAPGVAPSYQGKAERKQGLALGSQAQLNTLAGNIFAHKNAKYPSVDANLGGNYTNFDIAPQELVLLNTPASLNPRGVAFSNKRFVVTSVAIKLDGKRQSSFVDLGLAEVVAGVAAETVVIPDVPPTNTGGDPPTPNPVAPGGISPTMPSFFPIYHNDVFVGNAQGLNFLDSDYISTGTA
jgi:hypothetical protein